MHNFNIKCYNFRQDVARGYISFQYTPKDYWTDAVKVNFTRSHSKDGEWKIDISGGSGGYNGRIGHIERIGYLIEALAHARNLAERLVRNQAKYESYAQFKDRKEGERLEARIEARRAEVAKDKAVGPEAAERIVKRLKARVAEDFKEYGYWGCREQSVRAKKRGPSEVYYTIRVLANRAGRVEFRWDGDRKSTQTIINKLANTSEEYYFVENDI